MNDHNISEKLVYLRKRASTFLLKNPNVVKPIVPAEVNKLIYELHIHQIELEMQNEELRKTQLALETSRNRYLDLYNFSPVGYFILNKNGIIDEVNVAGENLFGTEKHLLLKNRFLHFVSPQDQDEFHRFRQLILKSKTQRTCELTLIKKNNNPFVAQLIGIAVPPDTENNIQLRLALTDITEQRETQKKIRQRELELAHVSRLNTIGEMATGIAHELNQPLTAIVQYTGGCLARLRKQKISPDIFKMMERVMTQAERAGSIIHQLKAFLKKEQLQTTTFNINTIILHTLDLMEYEIKNTKIKVQLELAGSLPIIKGDQIQLQQVILNIAHNAVEAMQGFDIKQPKLYIQTHQINTNNIEIIIADTGHGIPSSQLQQIFDPFFTTKPKGMGMGLAIAYSIVEAHGGKIFVISKPGIGARFYVHLPITEKQSDTYV